MPQQPNHQHTQLRREMADMSEQQAFEPIVTWTTKKVKNEFVYLVFKVTPGTHAELLHRDSEDTRARATSAAKKWIRDYQGDEA